MAGQFDQGGVPRVMAATRRLAAILAADVAGYSRLMGADEEGTHQRLRAHFGQLVEPKIREHRGRTVKNTGDGLLAEFASVVDAVHCAVALQQAMPERNAGIAADSRIELRIGINLGDVIVEPDDIYGDGVNIAARVEAMADAGGVLSPIRSMIRSASGCLLSLRIWESSRSRTLPGRSGSTVFVTSLPPKRQLNQSCRFPTSRLSRCCPSPI
jgi:class 3 adenylate cyclase